MSTDPREENLARCLREASEDPTDDARWDALEDAARALQRPDEVETLYHDVLGRSLAPEVFTALAQRAMTFHDEWSSDTETVVRLLDRVVTVDPDARWAFDRLTMLLNVGERWPELLALYDRAIAAAGDDRDRLGPLLEEAAQVAKDFAAQPERAIRYLESLFALDQRNAQVARSLERLYERHARHRDLIALWTARIPYLPASEAHATRTRIASCWLDPLHDAASALAATEDLLAHGGDETTACALLEKIATASDPAVAGRAIQILKGRYDAAGRQDDVLRVLDMALKVAPDDAGRAAVHRELATRLLDAGREVDAATHYASLVVLEPSEPAHLGHLRELAEKTSRHDLLADALARAAETIAQRNGDETLRLTFLVQAAYVRADVLRDAAGAITLYTLVLASPGAPNAVALPVARRLASLLEEAGRDAERLNVLERLATLEPAPDARRDALGKAARLADQLGNVDRALSAWHARLREEPGDAETLDALVDLLARSQRWVDLIATLRDRARASTASEARRADMVRVATTYARELGQIDDAIEAWHDVQRSFGEDAETVDALASLLAAAERWDELLALLDRAARQESSATRRAQLLRRAGDVYRERGEKPEEALDHYRQALDADPSEEGARAGLLAMLDRGGAKTAVGAAAVGVLAKAYTATDSWEALLGVLEPHLVAAESPIDRARMLMHAADLYERRADDQENALRCAGRALPLAVSDDGLLGDVERELNRLAEASSDWATAVGAYREAIDALDGDAARAAKLSFHQGAILEAKVGDLGGALDAYVRVARTDPADLETARAVVRVGGRTGRWDAAAWSFVATCARRGLVEPSLVAGMEDAVRAFDEASGGAASGWDEATRALQRAIADASPPALVARALETRLGIWHRDMRHDRTAAEACLLRAVAQDDTDAETLRMLAELQRAAPGKALVDTLLALARAESDESRSLDALHEAADVSLRALDDAATSHSILARLLERAAERWRSLESGGRDGGEAGDEAQGHAAWALRALVDLHVASGRHVDAVDLLVRSAALPFEPAASRQLRHEAAERSARDLRDTERAMRLYRGILDEAPADLRAIERLALLYESAGRMNDLLALRRHELELTEEPSRRLELRLEIARIQSELGDTEGRIQALKANLDESPGHAASIEALAAVYESNDRYQELVALLTDQAAKVESKGDPDGAASQLWSRAAHLAETKLNDVVRAILAYEKVVARVADPDALDALARLHASRGEHTAAVGYLERRLEGAAGDAQRRTVVALARAHLATGKPERARQCLERALASDPDALEARMLLADLYRKAEAWEPLAVLLADGDVARPDALAALREAADILLHRLRSPERAVPVLERAAIMAPDDRGVRAALADALRAAGHLDEAKGILQGLIEGYGRQRPPERATAHYLMAQIAHARGETAEATQQLELASSIDMGHPGIFRLLGDLYRDSGQLERAERAYRALLMIVRRQASTSAAQSLDAIGPSEVLFELYGVAKRLGQEERAQETLESAFETASRSDLEARRFERALRTGAEPALLLRALELRLPGEKDSARQAELLGEMADVLHALGRDGEALDACLRALRQAPDASALHETTRTLARQTGQTARYVELLEALIAEAREGAGGPIVGGLYLQLGAVLEQDVHDPASAVKAYTAAEDTAEGDALVSVWSALDRLYASLGDTRSQARVLRKLIDAEVGAPADAAYRLAKINLASEEASTREEGLEWLAWALQRAPDHARAAGMLKRAAEQFPSHEAVLSLYLDVAREANDPAMLLDVLVRRAALADVALDGLREAVDLAASLGDQPRSEALLRRVIEVAGARDVLGEAVWALTALAERRREAGDLAESVRWMRRAVDVAEPDEAFQIGLQVASLATGPLNDLAMAAETYEKLLQRDPAERNVWEPLLEVYRRLGDTERLERLIEETVSNVFDRADRNHLRLERARILLVTPERTDDAVATLRAVLDEDPDDVTATTTLADLFERLGRNEDLADLLMRQFDHAREQRDVTATVTMGLRLASLLRPTRREGAMDVLRLALEVAPENAELLRTLVGMMGPDDDATEHANLLERIQSMETGAEVARLALRIAELRLSVSDEDGAERALTAGFRAMPTDAQLRARLEERYSAREDWSSLAQLREVDAEYRTDPLSRSEAFQSAAVIYRDRLREYDKAAELIRRAREPLPHDTALLADHVRCLTLMGDFTGAMREVSEALEAGPGGPEGVAELLRLRATVRAQGGDENGAVEDLESALAQSPTAEVARDLVSALGRKREAAARAGDAATERASILRLIDVLPQAGDASSAQTLLHEWIERNPTDIDALHRLAALHESTQRWDAAAGVYQQLVAVEQGPAQVEAAMRFADACERAGNPADARAVLERVYATNRGNDTLRGRMRALYEKLEASREVASLWMDDAEFAPDDVTRFERLRKAGEVWLDQVGDAEQAVPLLEQARALKTGDHDITVLLADAYTLTERLEEATRLLKEAIDAHKGRRSKELAVLQHRMGRVAYAAGDHQVELAWLSAALDTDMQNGQVAAELADVSMELGNYDAATKALRAVTLMKNPAPMTRAQAFLKQGMISQMQGDAKKAAFLARKALSEDPNLNDAQEFLAQLGAE